MKPSAHIICAVALLWRLGHVSCQEGAKRPKDAWEVKVWGGLGGLPALDAGTKSDTDTDTSIISKAQSLMPEDPPGHLLLPNPCTDAGFLRPNYTLSGLNLTRTFLNATNDFPALYQANVSVHDAANNISMRCSGEIQTVTRGRELRIGCVHENGLRDNRFQGYAWLDLGLSGFEPQEQSVRQLKEFQLEQYWVCPPEPVYPRVYRAVVLMNVNATCPPRTATTTNTTSSCRVPVDFPPFTQPSFTLKGPQDPPEPLVQRPSGPPIAEERPNPPAAECADVSLTHPNWVVEDIVYFPNYPRVGADGQTLNLTITSRATGVTQRCYWGWDNVKTEYLWYGLKLACQPLDGAPTDLSRTVFDITFWSEGISYNLWIRQNWMCGDKKGTYSRKYHAGLRYFMPLFCADDGGRVCTANRHTVKGELFEPVNLVPQGIPSPPGANRVGCTADSAHPKWAVHKFRYDEVRYREGRTTAWGQPSRTIMFAVENFAINFTQECRITIPADANLKTQWFRCYSDPGLIQYPVQTYVFFDADKGDISLNQTWYCADTDPSRPLLFQGTGTTWSDYCGETNTTLPVCETKKLIDNGACPARPECCRHYNTRWCAIGLFNNLSPGAEVMPYARSVTGGIKRTERLPSHALTDPDPDPDAWSCTAASVGQPVTWTLSSNNLESNWRFTAGALLHVIWGDSDTDAEKPSFYLNMRLANSVFARRPGAPAEGFSFGAEGTSTMVPWVAGWRPAMRYGLASRNEDLSVLHHRRPFRNVVDWGVRFDVAAGYLEVSHSWFCNDKNASAPILFNGTWSGYLNMSCAWNAEGVSIACGLLPDWGNKLTVTPKVTWARLDSMKGLPENVTYPYGY